jgi:hypothetical protein
MQIQAQEKWVVVPQYFQLELDIYGLAGFSFLVWSDVEQRHTWRQGQALDAGHRGERDHQGSRRRAGRPEPAEFLPKVCCLGEAVSDKKEVWLTVTILGFSGTEEGLMEKSKLS